MTEPKKFDDQKLLFSAVIEEGGESCSLMLGVEGIGVGELSPITREGTLDDIAILVKEMSEELRRGFATYVVENAAKKKKKRRKAAPRKKTNPPPTTSEEKEEKAKDELPAGDAAPEAAVPAGEEEQDGQNSFWDAF